ncbi:MAG: 3-dehydroquinate synthase [Legionellales bacterium]|nr:3-dehydroquinate synthase [Legionellales bacterium]
MEVLHVSNVNDFEIIASKRKYQVVFEPDFLKSLQGLDLEQCFFIIDKNVKHIYQEQLSRIILSARVLEIDANELSKSLESIPNYVQYLVENNIKRGQLLVAIGGGVTQDICCFLSTNLFRGLDWIFYPTTLLAQADSCIGSKSSINCLSIKNIMGSFNPPNKVYMNRAFLNSLEQKDIFSGIGEIIKAHAIDSLDQVAKIKNAYQEMLIDFKVLEKFIYQSMMIKKRFIEVDEFDQGIRNIFNYGHSFGHAIEAATNYEIPHGIAVTMGMDFANYVAYRIGINDGTFYRSMHQLLFENYQYSLDVPIDLDRFLNAIAKDKKNTTKDKLTLILPNHKQALEKVSCLFGEDFKAICNDFLCSKMVELIEEG